MSWFSHRCWMNCCSACSNLTSVRLRFFLLSSSAVLLSSNHLPFRNYPSISFLTLVFKHGTNQLVKPLETSRFQTEYKIRYDKIRNRFTNYFKSSLTVMESGYRKMSNRWAESIENSYIKRLYTTIIDYYSVSLIYIIKALWCHSRRNAWCFECIKASFICIRILYYNTWKSIV
jgi:hypothetical protein